ncbi:alpha/beta fold hydrolase [Neorhizobium sp. DAR64872/K0K18]|uniref:alpha/beta fold hydrolase n=1 Tax=Neorhizobium sp. DAR64872/K0K18 TaxID=3421958 RepID=UPI003D2D711D
MHHSRRTLISGMAGLFALTIGTATGAPHVYAAPTVIKEVAVKEKDIAHDAITARSSDGTMLVGEVQGDPKAPEILFIHGLRQSRLSWEKQLSDPALQNFRIVTFDLRGHGDSDKPTSLDAYSEADNWADDVAAIISASKLRRPVIVGWSLGGYVAGAYLRKYGGEAIAGVNLVDAVTKLSPDLFSKETVDFIGPTVSHDLATRTKGTADFLAACFHQPPSELEMQRMLVINGMTGRAVYEGFLQTKTTDLEPVFKAYTGPILLTYGVHDRLVRIAMLERIKAIHPNSQLSIFSHSGHSPFYEEPHRFNKELADFVRSANNL